MPLQNVKTLGELRRAKLSSRSVKDEIRANLVRKLQAGEALFPGIFGYDDTVVPQLINAILSRHNFILLGLRGQAKSRILRALTCLLDESTPFIAGCEIHDNPYAPICRRCFAVLEREGDGTPIDYLTREERYVEKLATPDVTIADLIGDIDPIKAARGGHELASELTVHYGLLPRANRGIFAINELPDLAGKIQVGLFNIMQEGDVQIKGYPVRLPLDIALVFSANPEDYTARGKIITPLKDGAGAADVLQTLRGIQGLMDKLTRVNVGPKDAPEAQVSAAEFVLEGLYAHKRIGRNEERVFTAGEKQPKMAEKPYEREEGPFRP